MGILSFLLTVAFIFFGLPLIIFFIWCLMPTKEEKQAKKNTSPKTIWNPNIARPQPDTEHYLKEQAYEKVPDEFKPYVSSIQVRDRHAKVSFDFKDVEPAELSAKANTLKRAMDGEIIDVVCDGQSVKDKQVHDQKVASNNDARNQEIDIRCRYKEVTKAFEKYIQEYSFEKHVIDATSTVYIVEDSAVILIQLVKAESGDWCGYPLEVGFDHQGPRYKTNITEVTYNGVFNFVKSRFGELLGFYHFADFTGFGYYGERTAEQIYINKHLPEIDIFKRVSSWDGVPYTFVVFETEDENGVIGRACYHTKSSLVTKEAHKVAVEIQNTIGYLYRVDVHQKQGMYEHIKQVAEEAGTTAEKEWLVCSAPKHMYETPSKAMYFGVDDEFKRIMFERIARMKDASKVVIKKETTQFFDDRVKWFSFVHGIKDLFAADFANTDYDMLRELSHGSYHDVEREVYVPLASKWKSEELMFRCVQNVFKGKQVIYQHHPFFLGLQSYDVFVPGCKIAFEYQGKQHFEPVEFFGGEESYKSLVERDKRKKKLSDDNGITLIYVNYWEEVNEELIKEKVKEAGKARVLPKK